MYDNEKAYQGMQKAKQDVQNTFTTANEKELNNILWEPDFSEVTKGIGPIWKRYHEAKARETLDDELDDINASYRALEYFVQVKIFYRWILDIMELRGARFYQDKPEALAKTADALSACIVKSINTTKITFDNDPELTDITSNSLDTIEELTSIFPDFKPDTSSFVKNNGKFVFSEVSVESLIAQFTDYILDHWNRNFGLTRRQIIHDIVNTIEPELGTRLTHEEREMAIKLGTTVIEDDKAEFRNKFEEKIKQRLDKTYPSK